MPPSGAGSRTQRRVARTKAAIEDAFVQLVLEHGYEQIAVEEISERADLARATFYAHYPSKEAVLSSVFSRLIEDLMQRISYNSGPWDEVRPDATRIAYEHAAEMADLYRACLSNSRTRQAYLSTLTRYAEQNFQDRLSALHRLPRVPVPVMARGFAGAHVAILESWLAGELDGDIGQLATMALDLLVAGAGWASGLSHDQLGYTTAAPSE